jgi:Ca-activated chloride channel family protein
MRFFYSKWDDELFRKLKELENLMAIFNYLLMRLNGDVEQTLKAMRRLQEMGQIPPEYDLDEFERELQRKKIISVEGGRASLTRKGERGLRRDAFEYIFEKLKSSGAGAHPTPLGGGDSEEKLPEKRPYIYGDNLNNLDLAGSLMNSVVRSGSLGMNLAEDDLEVYDTTRNASCATVVLIDISHSMILYGEDRITPAKQVAMAFTELIRTKYPKDSLNIVLFGNEAREIQIKDLPYIGAGPFHTNTRAGLQVARNILMRRKNPNKQIFMITDGKPSMIRRRNGSIYKNPMGLDPIIVNRTLDEAVICRKKRIPITTFMITDDPYLQEFVKRLTELNKGRAYFSKADNLGDFVFYDYLTHRRRQG